MDFIKNTIKAVKKNPKAFWGVGQGLTDVAVDMISIKQQGFEKSWIPYTIKSVALVYKNFKEVRTEIIEADKILISIDPDDEIVQDILTEWYSSEAKSVVHTDYRAMTVGDDEGLKVAFVPTSEKEQKLHLPNGSCADLVVNKVPIIKNGKPSDSHVLAYNIYVDNQEDYEVFVNILNEKIKEYTEPSDKPIRLYSNSVFGFNRRDLPRREFDSVILKKGSSEYLSEFLESFFDNKDVYVKKGFVHRTGILFHGPPGTGKTSIATAIANKYHKNVYQIQLSAVSGDEELVSLFNDIPPNNIVLLEDIDVAVKKSKNRKENSGESSVGITLAALLNVIDGNFAPDDTVFIMTTNDKDSLDPALTRPGRTDLHIHVDFLDNEQLDRMCEYYIGFIPDGIPDDIYRFKIEPAKVVSIFREHVLDPQTAAKALVEELQNRGSSV